MSRNWEISSEEKISKKGVKRVAMKLAISNNFKYLRFLSFFFVGIFSVLSCSTEVTQREQFSGTSSSGEEFADEEATPPANTTGSFMDFTCEEVQGNVGCIVRHNGFSLPLGDEDILGQTRPKMVIYLTDNVNQTMGDFEQEESIEADTVIDDNSDWGFRFAFEDQENQTEKLFDFLTSNAFKDDMGLIVTVSKNDYEPVGGSSERKYSVLSRCLFAHYLDEWLQGDPKGEDQVTQVPLDPVIANTAPALLGPILESQECGDLEKSDSYWDDFNGGMGDLFYDYLGTKGIGDEQFDAVAAKYN